MSSDEGDMARLIKNAGERGMGAIGVDCVADEEDVAVGSAAVIESARGEYVSQFTRGEYVACHESDLL